MREGAYKARSEGSRYPGSLTPRKRLVGPSRPVSADFRMNTHRIVRVDTNHLSDQYEAIERLLKLDANGESKNIKLLAARAKLPRSRHKSWPIGPKG